MSLGVMQKTRYGARPKPATLSRYMLVVNFTSGTKVFEYMDFENVRGRVEWYAAIDTKATLFKRDPVTKDWVQQQN